MRALFLLATLLVCCGLCWCTSQPAKESNNTATSSSSRLSRAQSRADHSRNKAKLNSDMQSVLQQHLVGPSITAPSGGSSDKELRGTSGKEESKKGRLQTVGSVLGDIIGVLVSEVARFFGSVVSDVAREVTAHGFVSLFKQFADIFSVGAGAGAGHAAPVAAPGAPHFG